MSKKPVFSLFFKFLIHLIFFVCVLWRPDNVSYMPYLSWCDWYNDSILSEGKKEKFHLTCLSLNFMVVQKEWQYLLSKINRDKTYILYCLHFILAPDIFVLCHLNSDGNHNWKFCCHLLFDQKKFKIPFNENEAEGSRIWKISKEFQPEFR